MQVVARLSGLRSLRLSPCHGVPTDLAPLAQLPRLKHLHLEGYAPEDVEESLVQVGDG